MWWERNPHIPHFSKMRFYPEIPHQPKTTVQDEENVSEEEPGVRGACTL